MGERLEEHLQQAVRGMLLLPEGKISSPVVVAGQIADLSAALALASHHAGIDLRAALDITMGRESPAAPACWLSATTSPRSARASHAANLRSALQFNRERLQRASEEFDTSRALSPADGMVEMESVARSLHRLGVILAARTIVLAGARDARAEVMPHAVSDFVSVLGAQQLPDYARASSLPPVARLLTEHGAVGDSIDLDADLLAELGAKCDLKTDPALWRLLPQLLAASLQLPPWSSLTADLASDALPNNLHTVAFALHALLSMHARAAAHTDEAAAEPLVAGRLLLLEHLARLASPLSPAALLHDVLPHGLTATHNAQAWQAASGAEKKNSFPRTGTGGKRA
ncbi:hypothetical protein EMIHUDRAFT_447681 [Emiliania huxleyi CCMP1516]|uniref:Uncharacterized protein n=2 Tax=Emiliania huxleyi TaxID=2903 RepID=A0A0D3JH26_EMIH1|nr:hypothetical protein EMIHUDRAFT_447681 [Emiliania huxleyi CCMP1516]EOD22811.1 hypothetical protein EMIHUDRAFT_447681 [Emiliania huxleyi CCMP1516]|eukprot:XP_005775240.1 hypothetical protein EMIHUDRAFT_447681 [Emiliania huxleyi CCMP1516]